MPDVSWEGNNSRLFLLLPTAQSSSSVLPERSNSAKSWGTGCCAETFFFLGRWIPMCNCPALTDSHNILLLCLPEMGPSESQSRVCYIQEYFLQRLLEIKIKSKWIGGRG